MSKEIKIALIVCDIPVVAEKDHKDTYENLFNTQLVAALEEYKKVDNSSAKVSFKKVDAFNVFTKEANDAAYPNLDQGGYSAILISGSRYDAYSDTPWIKHLVSWTKKAIERNKEVIIGSCFGHQIIALALGGKCVKSTAGWEVGATDIELSAEGKTFFKTDNPTLSIHQMHQDIITLPPGCTNLASTGICSVQGLIKRKSDGTIHAFSVQGHPEFNERVVTGTVNILASKEFKHLLNEAVATRGKENAKKPHNGADIIGRAMWRCILGN